MSERRDTETGATKTLWTIDELGAQVALALSVDYEGQSNGQIRDVPNRRTIRYYGTLGLIDRPATMRGRTAFYGRRHLMQLVAIKRLQREGLSLAQVQRRLAGVTDATLSRLARLAVRPGREAAIDRDVLGPAKAETAEPPRSGAFWQSEPAEVSVEPSLSESIPAVRALQALELSAGVSLLLDGEHRLTPEDVDAITTAAAPLLSLLRARELAP